MFNATRQDFERVYTENGLTAPPSPAVPKTGARPVSAAAAAGTKSLKADPAPHWVVYHNAWRAGGPPPVADVAGFNAFIITFLLTSGPFDMALEWANIGADARAAKKAEYNDAGIKLMISAFGATDHPTTAGADPVSLANTMAQYVKDYNLDGIDVDWEDFDAMAAGTGENWLIAFTTQLRSQLPSADGYIITHAPVTPWFTPTLYPGGGYLKVHQEVGSLIDWYNLQFYNQGTSEYVTCEGLLDASSSSWPETAIFEINANGVSHDKLVIGKPAAFVNANNGHMEPGLLAECVGSAKERGWNGGAMAWQYPDAQAEWIRTVRSLSWPV
ncbi:glycoside hydrolase family 18 protein [Pterulicium gracile]|uniref:Glycoside hydrolase family 18 protein n=1 Tax=Pterulicium gracile TaxID=1884261 RepID=A0A5C3Q4G5_9AGAR|nr:glycoside hydrolase family 18 protein [Pterula gracilis]